MRRIARITEDLGRDAGGFYVEPPDMPEGVSCQEWRLLRFEIRNPQPSAPEPATSGRPALVPRRKTFRVRPLRIALP